MCGGGVHAPVMKHDLPARATETPMHDDGTVNLERRTAGKSGKGPVWCHEAQGIVTRPKCHWLIVIFHQLNPGARDTARRSHSDA